MNKTKRLRSKKNASRKRRGGLTKSFFSRAKDTIEASIRGIYKPLKKPSKKESSYDKWRNGLDPTTRALHDSRRFTNKGPHKYGFYGLREEEKNRGKK